MMKRKLKRTINYKYDVEAIFKEYYGPLCFFASKFVQEEEAVEDIVQDVFIGVLEKKASFATETHLKNFLYLSIRNACLNFIRGRHSREKYVEALGREEETEDFQEELILTEVYKELTVAVNNLPPECRKVFDLCYFQGLDNEATAQTLGVSVNTVKAQKVRGKRILKENLRDIFPLALFLLNTLDKC